MISFVASFLIASSSLAMQGNDGLLTDHLTVQGSYIILRAADCSAVYYTTLSYKLSESESFILEDSPNHKSNLAFVTIQALNSRPADEESRRMIEWARSLDSKCASQNMSTLPYPAFLQSLNLTESASVQGFTILHSRSLSGTSKYQLTVQIEANSIAKFVYSGKSKLRLFNLNVQTFQSEVEAYAELKAKYSMATEFILSQFVEKDCHQTKDCDLFGRCKRKYRCDETPRVVQALKSGAFGQDISMSFYSRFEASESKISQLEEELINRLATSVFLNSRSILTSGALRPAPGKMEKHASDEYHDFVSIEHIRESTIVQTISLPELQTFLKNRISKE